MAPPATPPPSNQPSGKMGRRLQRKPNAIQTAQNDIQETIQDVKNTVKPIATGIESRFTPPPRKTTASNAPASPSLGHGLNWEASRQQRTPTSDAGSFSDTPVTDSSVPSESNAHSVLDLGRGPRSYTDQQQEDVDAPIAGGGYMEQPWMEMERMKLEDARRANQLAQLLGSDVNGLDAPPSSLQEQTTEETSDADEPDEEEIDPNETPEEREARYAQQLMQDPEEIKKQMRDEAKKQLEAQMKARLQKMKARGRTYRYSSEAIEIAGSEVLIPLLVLIAQLNIQMIWKYLFKRKNETGIRQQISAVLDQSIWEDLLTISVDYCVCISSIVLNPFCMLPLLLLGGLMMMPGMKTLLGAIEVVQRISHALH